jgi:nitroimidazol reductase NimA-like FMN-containing flavoprotein (pyridoxamine 5'-phosphate oxidase superfamily)
MLAPGGHGRVAATMGAIPIIVPVIFTLCGDNVIFVPGPAPAIARAVTDSVVAFETDHLGSNGRTDWEVHVTGVATALSCQNEAPEFRLSSELMTGWQAG